VECGDRALVASFVIRPSVFAIVGGHEVRTSLVQAVALLDHCSGTLVSPNLLLTSAHCLDGRVERASVGGRESAVAGCERHPAYLPGNPSHDIGYCRLKANLEGAVRIDEAFAPSTGAPVLLAGFGQSGPFSRERPTLRLVATSVVDVRPTWMDVGADGATACRGDSGGPMLVEREDGFHVVGIIQGGQSTICRGATQIVPLGPHMNWLRRALQDSSNDGVSAAAARTSIGVFLLGAVALAVARRWWRRLRTVNGH
jgi:hypothetical protein